MKPLEPPPVRRLFVPEPEYTLFEADLKRADPQIVAKESGEDALLKVFRDNIDVYKENAKWVYGKDIISGEQRQWNKNGVNAIDYACKAKTLATTLHCSEAKATEYIDRWIHRLYPGIGEWHRRIDDQLRKTRTVRNIYGFRKYFADRLQHLLPQALAWIASSTVSVTINKGLLRIYYELPEVIPMLQIHDSVLGQIPSNRVTELLPQIKELMEVEIPYKEPLVIPVTLKISNVSWGDVKDWSEVA